MVTTQPKNTKRGDNIDNLLSLDDSDMLDLYGYKENLPSLDSTQEIKSESDEPFFIENSIFKDFDSKPVNTSEGKIQKIQDSNQLNAGRRYTSESFLESKLDTIEEDEITESDNEVSISKAFDYACRTPVKHKRSFTYSDTVSKFKTADQTKYSPK